MFRFGHLLLVSIATWWAVHQLQTYVNHLLVGHIHWQPFRFSLPSLFNPNHFLILFPPSTPLVACQLADKVELLLPCNPHLTLVLCRLPTNQPYISHMYVCSSLTWESHTFVLSTILFCLRHPNPTHVGRGSRQAKAFTRPRFVPPTQSIFASSSLRSCSS